MTELERIRPAGHYTATEAARALNVSRMTLWRKTRDGRIRSRFNAADGSRFYKGTDLLDYHNREI